MASPPVLTLQSMRLTFGGSPILDGVDLAVGAGERIALVGRNGSGKSTLLKIAAGQIEADGGTRFIQPGATIRYLPQEPDLAGYASVLSYVEAGLAPGDDPYRAHALLGALSMDPDASPENLSGGEIRRAALARLLAPEPDIILLDEPTNHLDLPAINWLEQELAQMRSAMVIISHDRRFLQNLTRSTVWVDRGRSLRLDQGFAAFEQWRDQIFEQEETEAHKLGRQIAREEDWMRYGVTARRKRNMRRVGELQALRERQKNHRKPQGGVKMQAAAADLSGEQVIVAETISKSFGERVIVRDLSLRILRGDRIGIIGPNGAGKTTLINLLTGALAPDKGAVRQGTRLNTVLIDQRRELLDERMTVSDVLTGGRGDSLEVNGESRHVIGYLKDFLFVPEQVRQPVSALSGGERARLLLAKALAAPSNLLILDEPTNDLDLETLDLLEELLCDYAGTVILVSHDRDCLDRVCSAVLMAEEDGRWTLYAGGYTDMLAQRGEGVKARAKPVVQQTPKTEGESAGAGEKKSTRRLGFKEKHALETLPARMEALGRDIAKIQKALDDPDLFTRDRSRFDALMKMLDECQTQLGAHEEEWLRIELLREEIEKGGA
jgi:ATP-binding cassette subfamily F protein uup